MTCDFGTWLSRQKSPEEDLYDKLEAAGFEVNWKHEVECQCCVCGGRILLTDYISKEECLKEDPGKQYCGGSQRCCP